MKNLFVIMHNDFPVAVMWPGATEDQARAEANRLNEKYMQDHRLGYEQRMLAYHHVKEAELIKKPKRKFRAMRPPPNKFQIGDEVTYNGPGQMLEGAVVIGHTSPGICVLASAKIIGRPVFERECTLTKRWHHNPVATEWRERHLHRLGTKSLVPSSSAEECPHEWEGRPAGPDCTDPEALLYDCKICGCPDNRPVLSVVR